MSSRLLFCSIVSALAGFLFGFDTVVISGAEQTIQDLWQLSDAQHGLVVSAALWATVVGSMVGGLPTDAFGRKPTLVAIGVAYTISAIWSAMAGDYWSLIVARSIGGLGVGIATVAAPMYISEIAPAAFRGRLAGLFQFNIVFGILAAFLSNYLITLAFDTGADDFDLRQTDAWRWMLGVEAVPAAIYAVMALFLPESPRYLLAKRGDLTGAIAGFRSLDATLSQEDAEARVAAIAGELTSTSEVSAGEVSAGKTAARPRSLGKPVLLAFLIAMFNQLSGINVVLYYAKRIFELAGLGESAAGLSSIGLGITNLAATMLGLALIDRAGRRTLLLIGSLGYIVSLGACAASFQFGAVGLVPWCLFLFIASHAVGQGAVIWVFISEIFPTRARAFGQSLGSATHWVFAAGLTLVTPLFLNEDEPAAAPFAFFAVMMVVQLVWVLTQVPETKGVPLEEIERRLG